MEEGRGSQAATISRAWPRTRDYDARHVEGKDNILYFTSCHRIQSRAGGCAES